MRITELATATGVNVQTVRYYERRGILGETVRTAGGFRNYPPDAVHLIRFVKGAQELGFTLVEIEMLLRVRKANGSRDEVRALMAEKRREVDGKIRDLQAIRRSLDRLLHACLRAQDEQCPVLHALGRGPTVERKS